MSQSGTNIERTLATHTLFMGSREMVKRLVFAALLLEVVSSVVASYRIVSGGVLWGGWASLVMLFLIVVARVLRFGSRGIQAFSQRCRRLSARAFASGGQVGAAALSGLMADAPTFTERFAKQLPGQTPESYYEPTTPAGLGRLQEIYAHSSFYSWILLRRTGRLLLFLGTFIAVGGAVAIYALAVRPPAATTAARLLDVVCSLVFIVLSAKALSAGADSLYAARGSRRIADALIVTAEPERIGELTALYDMERNSGPLIPTRLYQLGRKNLQERWYARRVALNDLEVEEDTKRNGILDRS